MTGMMISLFTLNRHIGEMSPMNILEMKKLGTENPWVWRSRDYAEWQDRQILSYSWWKLAINITPSVSQELFCRRTSKQLDEKTILTDRDLLVRWSDGQSSKPSTSTSKSKNAIIDYKNSMGGTTAIVLESQATRGGVVSPWLVDVSIPNAWNLC